MRYGSSLPGRRQGHRWPCKDPGLRVRPRARASPFSFCCAFTVFRTFISLSLTVFAVICFMPFSSVSFFVVT